MADSNPIACPTCGGSGFTGGAPIWNNGEWNTCECLGDCECQTWARTDMMIADLEKPPTHHPKCMEKLPKHHPNITQIC